jgi:DNA gyrase subunit A
MLITDKGVLVRTRVSEIREMGRATQGVTLIGLDAGSQLSGLQRIVENDANPTESSEDGADPTVDSTVDPTVNPTPDLAADDSLDA